MDSASFDRLTRLFVSSPSRRALGGAILGSLAGLLGITEAEAAAACPPGKKRCRGQCILKRQCCTHTECRRKIPGSVCRARKCQCPAGRKLCKGVCIPKANCCDNRGCRAPKICQNRRCCSRLRGACTRAAHCCNGLQCSDSTNTCCAGPGGTCQVASDCCAGECESNVCVLECSTSTDCPLPSQACAQMVCTNRRCDVEPVPLISSKMCRESAGPCDVPESCDGSSLDCPSDQFQRATEPCRAAQCLTENFEQLAANCTGRNSFCPGSVVRSCGLYRCIDTACRTTCASDGECVSSAFCAAQTCRSKLPNGQRCFGHNYCQSGACVDGTCCNSMCSPLPPNTTRSCATGTCTFTCVSGWGACDGNPGNGCNTDLMNDSANCGVCGRNCFTTNPCGDEFVSTCEAGSCVCG